VAAPLCAQGLGLAAEARSTWFGPATPLLMDWAAGGRSSGAEVIASGLLPQCIVRAGLLGALPPAQAQAGTASSGAQQALMCLCLRRGGG